MTIPTVVLTAAVDRQLLPRDVRVYVFLFTELDFFLFRPLKHSWLARRLGIHRSTVGLALGRLLARGRAHFWRGIARLSTPREGVAGPASRPVASLPWEKSESAAPSRASRVGFRHHPAAPASSTFRPSPGFVSSSRQADLRTLPLRRGYLSPALRRGGGIGVAEGEAAHVRCPGRCTLSAAWWSFPTTLQNAPRPGSPEAIRALAERWAEASAAERANFQSYLIELCHALGVEPPRPAGTSYEFEYPITQTLPDGREAPGFIDCYKRGHFILEAKDEEAGRSREAMLRLAFGQAKARLANLPDAVPPYLLVMDVGTTLIVWDRWDGGFGGFQAGRRIDLTRLADRDDDAALIRDIFEDPSRRDRRRIAAAVTTEIAGRLAELAAALEDSGHDGGRVARFLMRCVFSLFAEDVGLLEGEPFRELIGEALRVPAEFVPMAQSLWSAMDRGERFGLRKLLRFNGHFFADADALPLTREQLALLSQAAAADWQHVEPAIFGTLLVRALDPEERHRLGAEYTPPEYIARLVEPTLMEPIQERWKAVQLEVLPLLESQKAKPAEREKDRKAAVKLLTAFHAYLRGIQILDPACGSGNFLYIALHALKRLELEVVRELARAERNLAVRLEEIGPWQFHGIEVQSWAREIAELTLWIGFHQFWRAHHAEQPDEPILRDTGTLEHRDAVLTWRARCLER